MTKQMRKEGVQFHNRRNGDMFKIEDGIVYKRIKKGSWLMMLGLDENKLLADDDIYYLNGGRNLVIVISCVLSLCLFAWIAF